MASGDTRVAVILIETPGVLQLPGRRHRADYPERHIWATGSLPGGEAAVAEIMDGGFDSDFCRAGETDDRHDPVGDPHDPRPGDRSPVPPIGILKLGPATPDLRGGLKGGLGRGHVAAGGHFFTASYSLIQVGRPPVPVCRDGVDAQILNDYYVPHKEHESRLLSPSPEPLRVLSGHGHKDHPEVRGGRNHGRRSRSRLREKLYKRPTGPQTSFPSPTGPTARLPRGPPPWWPPHYPVFRIQAAASRTPAGCRGRCTEDRQHRRDQDPAAPAGVLEGTYFSSATSSTFLADRVKITYTVRSAQSRWGRPHGVLPLVSFRYRLLRDDCRPFWGI